MNPISFLLNKLQSWWREHKENEKWREFYARLDRNGEAKWSKSQYMKDMKRIKSVEKKRK